jgi:hypothetical protein
MWPSSSVSVFVSQWTIHLLGQEACDIFLIQGTLSDPTISGKPFGYFSQWDGGCVTPSNREGQCDGVSERVSLWSETLYGVDEVFYCPGSLKRLMSGCLIDALISWLLEETFFSHIQTSMSEIFRVPSNSL